MAKIYSSIAELVGRTPLLELKNYEEKHDLKAKIFVKLEYFNPNQSVKDRIALAMVEEAEKSGELKKDDTIIELTSGNTGIGLAAIAAAKGYKFRVYIQDQVSSERYQVIQAFGGETVKLSEVPEIVESFEKYGADFIEATKALQRHLKDEKNYWFADQGTNPANPDVHFRTTGPEIWQDTDGKVDIFVANVGTGGTLSGAGNYLKSQNPDVKIVALEPASSPVLSTGKGGPHKIQGIGAGFVPDVLNTKVYDEVYKADNEEGFATAKLLAKHEGILVGISSGAALSGAIALAKRPENKGKTIVALLPDSGDRYYSTPLFTE